MKKTMKLIKGNVDKQDLNLTIKTTIVNRIKVNEVVDDTD